MRLLPFSSHCGGMSLCALSQHHMTDSSDRFMAQEQNSAHSSTIFHQLGSGAHGADQCLLESVKGQVQTECNALRDLFARTTTALSSSGPQHYRRLNHREAGRHTHTLAHIAHLAQDVCVCVSFHPMVKALVSHVTRDDRTSSQTWANPGACSV